MALEILITDVQLEDVASGTIDDITGSYDALNNPGGYGTPNDDRNERGNYLLLSSNDKSGNRTYLTVTNSTPLSTLSWAFTSTEDGWHQATLLSVGLWNGSDPFVSSANDTVFYTVTGLFYVCIQNNTNIAPDSGSGSQYWEVVTDFTELQQDHGNIDVIEKNFLIHSRTSLDIADKLYGVLSEDFACKLDLDDASHPLNLIAMLEAAQSKMIDDKGDQADQIIDAIQECVS